MRLRHRVFFALYPPREAVSRIVYLNECLFDLKGSRVAPQRLHISLNCLGDYEALPKPLIASACAVASRLKVRPFKLVLNRIVSFKNNGRHPRVLVGDDGVIGARMLHRSIGEAFREKGVLRGGEPDIEPHLTLSREDHVRPEVFIEPAVTWDVREFRLIHSPQGESRHHVLGRWLLEG